MPSGTVTPAGGGGGSSPTLRAITFSDSPVTAVANSVYFCDTSGGDIAVTLPTPSNGDTVVFKKTDGAAGTVSFTSSALIDPLGANTAQPKITDFQVVEFFGYSSKWRITGEPAVCYWRGGPQVLGPAGGNVYISDSVNANASGAGLFWRANGGDGLGTLEVELGSGSDLAVVFGPNQGDIVLNNLPTADPHVVNKLWNFAGVLKVSAG